MTEGSRKTIKWISYTIKNMQIIPIPCLTDNYAYIISDKNSKTVGVVDPSEARPIISFLNKKNLKLNYILNTHHHFDHIGGNLELKKLYNAKVVGFAGDKHRIPGIDITLKDNDKWNFENLEVKILHIPGHTLGHICFFFEKEKVAFTGDTLFSLGCGRIFEGNHNQMLKSLSRIKKLPMDTKIYCGHEYTYKNLEFVLDELVDWQDKGAIKQKTREMIEKRGSSMPFDLGHQKEWNPFLNCNEPHYKKGIADFKGKINKDASELDFFTFIREKRNKF